MAEGIGGGGFGDGKGGLLTFVKFFDFGSGEGAVVDAASRQIARGRVVISLLRLFFIFFLSYHAIILINFIAIVFPCPTA